MWSRVRLLQPLLAHLRPCVARAVPASSSAARVAAPLSAARWSAAPSARGLATRAIVVPSLGDSISEGTLAEILLPAGSAVRVDDVVARLETDKVSMDIRSDAAGRIADWAVKVGDNVKVGAPLMHVEVGAEGSSPAPPAAASSAPAEKAAGPATFDSGAKPNLEDGHQKQTRPQPLAQSGTQQPQSSSPADAHTHHRVPLIAFRYGKREPRAQHAHAHSHGATAAPLASTGGTSADFMSANDAALAAWASLPARYKKKSLKEAQLAMIELGGAGDYEPKKKQRAQ